MELTIASYARHVSSGIYIYAPGDSYRETGLHEYNKGHSYNIYAAANSILAAPLQWHAYNTTPHTHRSTVLS